ncbi:hypothetical protein V2J09_014498 [Rumex salicifolius]
MDLKTPVIADPAPINKSRLGIHASLIPYSSTRAVYSSSLMLSIPRKKTVVLDDVRSNAWLDVMTASSPPPKKLAYAANSELEFSNTDLAYRTWLLKYPSALASFEQIAEFAKGKKLALFLDYDGTLSPIVDNPESAFMTDDMRSAVRDVAKCFPTAIISGRSRDKVYEFIGLNELYYAGSHGMDIMSPSKHGVSDGHFDCIKSTDKQGKEGILFQPASDVLPLIEEVLTSLIKATKDIKGATVENNKFCLSVHYRNVDEKDWKTVWDLVTDILKGYPRLRLTYGRKVLEVRPIIDWNKGKAVEFLLDTLGLADRDDVLPVYVGDDRTDEDAFKVLREGNRGYGILVSSIPKESNAFYSLKDPMEVMEFLKALVSWHNNA